MQVSQVQVNCPRQYLTDVLSLQPIVCSRFSCAVCGDCPASLATRCANLDCDTIVCYSCVFTEDTKFKKCRLCGKKARGEGKQRSIDYALNDAISVAYPNMQRESNVDMVQARHVKECANYIREVGNSKEMQIQGKSYTYIEEATLLAYGHSKNTSLQKWLQQSLCKCDTPYICISRLAKSGKTFLSCPAFNLDEKTRLGKSSTGCDFFKFI